MGLPSTSTLIGLQSHQPRTDSTRLHRRWLLLARMLWIAMFVLTLVFFCANLLIGNYGLLITILLVAVTSVWFAVSLVLFWRKSTDWVILLFSQALMLVGGVLIQPYPNVLVQWNYWVWAFPTTFLGFLAWSALIIAYLFPDGRFVPSFTRWLAFGWIAVSLVASLPISIPSAFSPLNWWSSPLFTLVRIPFCCSFALALLYRYRKMSTSVQRQQIKWVTFVATIVLVEVSAATLVLLVVPSYFPALGLLTQLYQLAEVITSFLSVFVPLSIGIALLRYRLWDIDLIINRTLVYAVLTLTIVTLYVLVVVGFGTLLQEQGNPGIALLATGLVAVLFQPLRTRLQRTVNRLMYGDRDDPYRVLSRLGQRLESTLAPEAVLPTIVETVALALKLPYTAIILKQGDEFAPAATYGTLKGDLMRLPLVYQTEHVGELLLAPRTPGETFSSADRMLLEDLGHQAGVAAHAVRLAENLKQLIIDLQNSRERLVTAREEERRRLRRDLHDGLGPQLASLTLKLETVRNRLAHDPLADTLLSDLTMRAQAAVADIRRLVYALRPPALDEMGLIPALREHALQYSDQGDNGLHISIEVPHCLPELSAAVEVAVYRIAQEALTNVVRHAHARQCTICLVVDERASLLTLSIQDTGCGLPPSRHVGVGLVSMRERAEELGGTWAIEPVASGGTCVLARLPYIRSRKVEQASNSDGRL